MYLRCLWGTHYPAITPTCLIMPYRHQCILLYRCWALHTGTTVTALWPFSFNLFAHVSVQYFSLMYRDSFTGCIGSTVLLPVTVLSIGYGGLPPMHTWLPEVAKLCCVSFTFLIEPREIFWPDLHAFVSPAYCSYIWYTPRPAMSGIYHPLPRADTVNLCLD